jgi:uncharacterized protein YkwD
VARFFSWLSGVGRPRTVAQPDWHLTLLALHNEARATRGADPLTAEWRLRQAAQAYADRLAAAGDGPATPADRIGQAGYVFRAAGENLTVGQPTPDAAFDAWMGSAGHFRNVVNPAFTHFGAGRATSAAGLVHWCCVFAAPAKLSEPTRLVYVHAPAGLAAGAPGPE